jgi:hypothetical protein
MKIQFALYLASGSLYIILLVNADLVYFASFALLWTDQRRESGAKHQWSKMHLCGSLQ